jgi:hypothetical protein
MRHAYGDANGYSHIHSDGNSDGNGHIYSDGDCDRNGDCDGAFANTDGNCHRNVDSDGDGNCYSNGDRDRTATAYTDATASTLTDATGLAFFGITGTRENDLASSQPKVNRLSAARRCRTNRRGAVNCLQAVGGSGQTGWGVGVQTVPHWRAIYAARQTWL